MKKFKITFVDETEAESEEAAYASLIEYLRGVVRYEDLDAFHFEEIKQKKASN